MSQKSSFSHFTPIIIICAASFLITACSGELRFCLNGPQRMKDADCPGGFVFKEGISPACKFYAKDGNQTGIVLSAPVDPCDDTTARAIENEDDLNDINTLAYFTWEEFEDTNNTNGSFNPENICQDECLGEWEDRNTAMDEEPIPEDWDPSSVSEDDKMYCMKMNKAMFIRILMEENDEDPKGGPEKPPVTSPPLQPGPVPPKPGPTTDPVPTTRKPGTTVIDLGTPPPKPGTVIDPVTPPPKPGTVTDPGGPPKDLDGRRLASFVSHNRQKNIEAGFSLVATTPYDTSQLNIIKLLAKSMKVAISACSPYINEDFYEQILKGMMHIVKLIEDKFLDLGSDLYKSVSKILDHCIGTKYQEFTLNGTQCDDLQVVKGVYFMKSKQYWPYRLTGRSFRWGKYHPILDATWTTLDIVQNLCFESFSSNMMMGHVYHMAMEGLFPAKMRLCWRVDPALKNDKFWNNLLQTYDLNVTMKNLDACAHGARRSSSFEHPLPRPFLTMEEASKEAPESTETHEPPKGWNKTIEKYWQHYERLGGFIKISEEFGKCFQPNDQLEEQEDMIANLKKSC